MSHYFDPNPKSAHKKQEISGVIGDYRFSFKTDSNTFSPDKLDLGSTLLAESADPKPGERVLDLGCGWGLVGIAVAKRVQGIVLTMTDVNSRAVTCAKENALRNNIPAEIKVSDGFAALGDATFDLILFNPPFSAGKKIWQPIVVEAKERLSPGGRIMIVGRHSKGGRDTEQFLDELFDNVDTVSRQSGYRVYRSFKKDKQDN